MTSPSDTTDLEPVGPTGLRWLNKAARAYATANNVDPDSFTTWIRQAANELHTQETQTETANTYCSQCDKPQGECEHHAPKYLDPIQYAKTETPNMYRVPDHERERWNDDTNLRSEGHWKHETPTTNTVTPLRDIQAKLEQHVYLNQNLNTLLHDAYLANPHQTALLANDIVTSQKAGQLTNPGGLLAKRLRGLID